MSDEYNCVLENMMNENWNGLFFIMIRTNDDILRKKIEQLLHSFEHAMVYDDILLSHEALLAYIHHAQYKTLVMH